MSDQTSELQDLHTARAKADVEADRACLCCRKTFRSAGFGARVCPRCKTTTAWRTGAGLLGA